MYLPKNKPILAIIGPSGTGKSTIVNALAATGLINLTPTWTDRPQRPGEDELEHKFVNSEEFERLENAGFFLHKPVSYFNLQYRYALPRIPNPSPNTIPVIMARIMALELLNHFYPERIIYQIEAPIEIVRMRLEKRSRQGVALGSRLSDFETEQQEGRKHAKRLITNDGSVEQSLNEIRKYLRLDFGIVDKV